MQVLDVNNLKNSPTESQMSRIDVVLSSRFMFTIIMVFFIYQVPLSS